MAGRMTFDQFMLYYQDRGIDWDGHYGYQCVDLERQYVNDVLGLPQNPPIIGAADRWDLYNTQYFDRLVNTPTAVPQKGDIIIWTRGYGPNGHIAVALGIGDTRSFYSYDQNNPEFSKPHIQFHNYNSVRGWLRVKAS